MPTTETPPFTLSFEPDVITSLADLTAFTLNGVRFQPGDAVWITHRKTGSRLYGTLDAFYGVGRIRGIRVYAPMVGQFHFPFLKPEDHETYAIEHADAGHDSEPVVTDAALAAAGKALAVAMHGDGADQQDADYYARHLRPALEAAYRATGAPQRDERGRRVLHLTSKEYGALSEAVRYSQEAAAETSEDGKRLNPTLSRIQRKLGEEPSA